MSSALSFCRRWPDGGRDRRGSGTGGPRRGVLPQAPQRRPAAGRRSGARRCVAPALRLAGALHSVTVLGAAGRSVPASGRSLSDQGPGRRLSRGVRGSASAAGPRQSEGGRGAATRRHRLRDPDGRRHGAHRAQRRRRDRCAAGPRASGLRGPAGSVCSSAAQQRVSSSRRSAARPARRRRHGELGRADRRGAEPRARVHRGVRPPADAPAAATARSTRTATRSTRAVSRAFPDCPSSGCPACTPRARRSSASSVATPSISRSF